MYKYTVKHYISFDVLSVPNINVLCVIVLMPALHETLMNILTWYVCDYGLFTQYYKHTITCATPNMCAFCITIVFYRYTVCAMIHNRQVKVHNGRHSSCYTKLRNVMLFDVKQQFVQGVCKDVAI